LGLLWPRWDLGGVGATPTPRVPGFGVTLLLLLGAAIEYGNTHLHLSSSREFEIENENWKPETELNNKKLKTNGEGNKGEAEALLIFGNDFGSGPLASLGLQILPAPRTFYCTYTSGEKIFYFKRIY